MHDTRRQAPGIFILHPLSGSLNLEELTSGQGGSLSSEQHESVLRYQADVAALLYPLTSPNIPSGLAVSRPSSPGSNLEHTLVQLTSKPCLREISVLSGFSENSGTAGKMSIYSRNSLTLRLVDGNDISITIRPDTSSFALRVEVSPEGAPKVFLSYSSGFRARGRCLYQFDLSTGSISVVPQAPAASFSGAVIGPSGAREVEVRTPLPKAAIRSAQQSDLRLLSSFVQLLPALTEPFTQAKSAGSEAQE